MEFPTKLVGVTFDNKQNNIRTLKEGDELTIVKEKNNPFHSKAILLTKDGKDMGYLSRELADKFYDKIEKVVVLNVTCKEDTYGVNIKVIVE